MNNNEGILDGILCLNQIFIKEPLDFVLSYLIVLKVKYCTNRYKQNVVWFLPSVDWGCGLAMIEADLQMTKGFSCDIIKSWAILGSSCFLTPHCVFLLSRTENMIPMSTLPAKKRISILPSRLYLHCNWQIYSLVSLETAIRAQIKRSSVITMYISD